MYLRYVSPVFAESCDESDTSASTAVRAKAWMSRRVGGTISRTMTPFLKEGRAVSRSSLSAGGLGLKGFSAAGSEHRL